MQRTKLTIVMLAAVLLFGGRGPLAKMVFGIDEIKTVDEERIASFLDESRCSTPFV